MVLKNKNLGYGGFPARLRLRLRLRKKNRGAALRCCCAAVGRKQGGRAGRTQQAVDMVREECFLDLSS